MTSSKTMLSAGKRLVAIAAGRAFKEDSEDSVEKRPKNREVENEMVKAPPAEGEPPTPATEPDSPPKRRY